MFFSVFHETIHGSMPETIQLGDFLLEKCISLRCLIKLLCISSHWDIQAEAFLVNITPLDADQFTRGCFSFLFIMSFKIACDFFL